MEQEQKGQISSGIYAYKHRCEAGLDIHEIFVKKSRLRVLLSYVGIVFLLANSYRSLLQVTFSCKVIPPPFLFTCRWLVHFY
jgi:phosphatidylinositol N-acetylglucosaminyltransferase subunit H